MTDTFASIIQKHVQQHYRYVAAVEEPWEYPSETFEQANGLSGISRNYDLPEGMTPPDMYLAIAKCESEHDMLSGYMDMAQDMGGFTLENLESFAKQLQQAQSIHRREMKDVQANGSLDEMEEKAMQGYQLEYYASNLDGMRDLLQAGCDAPTLQALTEQANDKAHAIINETYDELESRNPELSVLTSQIENMSQKRFVVLGALSKYNVADIKGFSIDGITYREAQKDPQWARQWDEIQQKTGGELDGWIPAKSTQMRILQQLRQRETKDLAVG
jgi:hypothetical protein